MERHIRNELWQTGYAAVFLDAGLQVAAVALFEELAAAAGCNIRKLAARLMNEASVLLEGVRVPELFLAANYGSAENVCDIGWCLHGGRTVRSAVVAGCD